MRHTTRDMSGREAHRVEKCTNLYVLLTVEAELENNIDGNRV